MRRIVARAVLRIAVLGPLLALVVGVVLGGTAHAGKTEQVDLTVEGMYCSNCERTVESVLLGVEGVQAADADGTSGGVHVTFEPARTSPAGLARAVNTQTYYQASLAGDRQPAGNPGGSRQDEATGGNTGDGALGNALLIGGLLAAALAGSWLLVRRARHTASRK